MLKINDSKQKNKKDCNYVPILRVVRNRTTRVQVVGKEHILPGMTADVDVALGSLGKRLVDTRVLEIIGEPVDDEKQYRCPICDFVCSEAGPALAHICREHTEEVSQCISEIMNDLAKFGDAG